MGTSQALPPFLQEVHVNLPVQTNPYRKGQILSPNPSLNGKRRQTLTRRQGSFLLVRVEIHVPQSYLPSLHNETTKVILFTSQHYI